MEKKIKWIYALTVVATCSVILMQVFWLRSQYILVMQQTLQQHADSVFEGAEAYFENCMDSRKLPVDKGFILSVRGRGMKQWYTTISSPEDTVDSQTARIVLKRRLEIRADSFDLPEELPGKGVGAAMTKYLIKLKWNVPSPAQLEKFVRTTVKDTTITIAATGDTSRVWQYKILEKHFFFSPCYKLLYGINPLIKRNVIISGAISTQPVWEQLGRLFVGAGVWTLLMILCLVYQARVLFAQYKIDTLRKNFSHTMIHELKRPVQALKMLIAFLQDKELQKDKLIYDKTLTDARMELDNLSAYFAKLRDVTYGDEKTIPLNKTRFDLGRLAEQAIRSLNTSDSGKHLRAVLQINGRQVLQRTDDTVLVSEEALANPTRFALMITADKFHISNIISNLLENAVKYSKPSFVDIVVEVSTTPESVVIKVRDRGKGISADDRPHVFEKFYRSRSLAGTDIPGIGLGLSYVKLLVEAHGGTVKVASEPGRETEFCINLPRRRSGTVS